MWKAAGTGMRAAQSMRSVVMQAQEASKSKSIESLGRSQNTDTPDNALNPFVKSNRLRAALGRASAQQDSSIGSSSEHSPLHLSPPANDDIDRLDAPRLENQGPAPAASASAASESVSSAHVNTNVEAHSASVEPNVNAPPRPPPMSPEQRREEEEKMMKLRDEVLSKTGRQNGPDIALKIIFNMKDENGTEYLKTIINENSSITEVMNVFAFLVNKTHDINSIVKEFSFFKYEHDAVGDYYTKAEIDENDANYEQGVLSVFEVLKNVEGPLFDIDTFKPYTGDGDGKVNEIILPAGIIKRDAESYHTAPIPVKIVHIPKLFTLCILQMINILEKTRGVFGGWTKLFKEMQGGGTKSKSTTKKTRRSNNCRRN